jgi:thermitase
MRTTLIGLLGLMGILAGGVASAQGYVPDEVLVKFQPGTPGQVRTSVHRQHGGAVRDHISALDVDVVAVPAGAVLQRVAAYSRNPNVSYAEPNFIAQAVLTPSDPYFGRQWGLNNTGQTGGTPDADMDVAEAWDITMGVPTQRIAILDTGIDQDHEDLPNIVLQRNFTSSRTLDDKYGHGTHCAGISAAPMNGRGVVGTAPGASLMNGKVLGDNGFGSYSAIADGITWATDNGATVISMSLGGSSDSATMRNAVNYAWNKNVVVVAAAGNEGSSSPSYPGFYANCIAVAATDHKDVKASFSNYGSWVDVAAPGVEIFATLPNHNNRIGPKNYGYLSGTSMATPHVAGVVALIRSRYPLWSNAEVRSRLESTCQNNGNTGSFRGRVNAQNAVQ